MNKQGPLGRATVSQVSVRVLMSLGAPSAHTRYATQMSQGLPADVTPLYFSYKTAFLGTYDIFHVHWPESLLRGSSTVRTYVRTLLALLLLLELALLKRPIVRTVHNEFPHESGSRIERAVLKLIDRRTSVFVVLNQHSATPPSKTRVHVPHGIYADYAGSKPTSPPGDGPLLFFGLVRPYKRTTDLIRAFRSTNDPLLRLEIAGNPNDESTRSEVVAAANGDSRIGLTLGFLDDDDLASKISQADLVVLPYEIHNSGAILLALSLHRPVLTVGTPSIMSLAEEVGAGWIQTFEPPLTDTHLRDALATARTEADTRRGPVFDARDWTAVGMGYRSAYVLALRSPRQRVTRGTPLLGHEVDE